MSGWAQPSAVTVYWDYENIRIPAEVPAQLALARLQELAVARGVVTQTRAYAEEVYATSKNRKAVRLAFQNAGWSLIDAPHDGRKDVVDGMIMVDMLCFALNACSTLRNHRTRVILITQPHANAALRHAADEVLDWRTDVLKLAPLPVKPTTTFSTGTGGFKNLKWVANEAYLAREWDKEAREAAALALAQQQSTMDGFTGIPSASTSTAAPSTSALRAPVARARSLGLDPVAGGSAGAGANSRGKGKAKAEVLILSDDDEDEDEPPARAMSADLVRMRPDPAGRLVRTERARQADKAKFARLMGDFDKARREVGALVEEEAEEEGEQDSVLADSSESEVEIVEPRAKKRRV
ncbi:hypothetical protein JCM10449v2_006555 [Rhodotorula kratochvilovae]